VHFLGKTSQKSYARPKMAKASVHIDLNKRLNRQAAIESRAHDKITPLANIRNQ
jgi:hypothetical protein